MQTSHQKVGHCIDFKPRWAQMNWVPHPLKWPQRLFRKTNLLKTGVSFPFGASKQAGRHISLLGRDQHRPFG
eukprot:8504736-Alexandrium_andersonii.AAC.1